MKPATPTPAVKHDPSLATIEAMITDLSAMRDAERDRAIKNAYQAAIDRLQGLAYRLVQPRPLTIGRPARFGSASPATEPRSPPPPLGPPHRTLPLGPVVVARKPRPR